MPAGSLIGDLLLAVFLAGCAWLDVKTRQVPNRLTVGALGLALGAAALAGNWPSVALVGGLILISGLAKTTGTGLALGGLAAAAAVSWARPELGWEAAASQLLITTAWLLWRHGLTGGADAKLLITLTLLYGSGVFLAAVLTGGLFGLAARLRQKHTLPYILPVAVGTIGYLALRRILLF
ncbi:MAG TPA: prepilin peptidase [Anaerolineaceae bacterium]|nr:prepilin peptidase [Anaerolineaceae bacterium]